MMTQQGYDPEMGGTVPTVEAHAMVPVNDTTTTNNNNNDSTAAANNNNNINLTESTVTNNDRWSLVWGALIIYWAFDAIIVFLVSFVGFLANMIFYIVAPSDCSQADTLFILSTLIFIVKFIDMTCGCCVVGCWFCPSGYSASDSQQQRQEQQEEKYKRSLLPHIRNCIIICIAQCLLSVAGIIVAIIGLVQTPSGCAGSTVGMIFNILLFLDSGWELFIWIGAYILRRQNVQDNAPIPEIVDKIVPNVLWDWAKKQQL